MTMILATCLVRQTFIEDYNRTFEETAYSLLNSAHNLAEEADDRGLGTEELQKEYQKFVNDYFRNTLNPPLQISVAVYDLDRNLLAQSGDIFDDPLFMLDDYFSFEEKDTLAKYYYENIQSSANYTLPGKYRQGRKTGPGVTTSRYFLSSAHYVLPDAPDPLLPAPENDIRIQAGGRSFIFNPGNSQILHLPYMFLHGYDRPFHIDGFSFTFIIPADLGPDRVQPVQNLRIP